MLSAMPVAPASAQHATQDEAFESMETTVASQWRTHFDEQIAQTLRRQPSQRATYVRIAMNEASQHESLELTNTLGVLLDIVQNDPNHDVRLMAVQALYTIGPSHVGERRYGYVMSQLYASMLNEESRQLRGVAGAAMSEYTQTD